MTTVDVSALFEKTLNRIAQISEGDGDARSELSLTSDILIFLAEHVFTPIIVSFGGKVLWDEWSRRKRGDEQNARKVNFVQNDGSPRVLNEAELGSIVIKTADHLKKFGYTNDQANLASKDIVDMIVEALAAVKDGRPKKEISKF